MKLVVGLGNPGKKYERTRHNAGWRAVRAFHTMRLEAFDGWKEKFSADVSEGTIGGNKVVLMLPKTFMNDSGDAVAQAVSFWKIAPADVIIVYDDLDIPLGSIRIRKNGSAGGHNGVKSVLERLGTEEAPRIRIGIGTEKAKLVPSETYVLEPFGKDEGPEIEKALRSAAEALGVMLTDGLDAAMNAYSA